MADLKISQLNTITTLTPATDVLPVVDVNGVTKKITTNQILGSSGTATLASATITGDLTVRTNKLAVTSSGVGFGTTTPAYPAHFRTTNPVIAIQDDTSAATGVGGTMNFLGFTSGTSGANIFAQIKGVKTAGSAGGEYQVFTSDSAGNSVQRYLIDSTGVSNWSVGGSPAMTLNSTGLGVGVASPAFKLQVVGTSGSLVDLCGSNVAGLQTLVRIRTATANTNGLLIQGNVSNDEMYINNFYNAALSFGTNNIERLRIDSSGNVGIGVTPSAWGGAKALDIGTGTANGSLSALGDDTNISTNAYYNAGWKFAQGTYLAARYRQNSGAHSWFVSSTNGGAGTATPTTASMVLDNSSNLITTVPSTPPTLTVNQSMVFNLTSNTNLRISVRGTDGVTRTANITLA